MNLTVKPDGRVRVTCGRRVSQRQIAHFVLESREFIQKRILEYETLRKHFPEKQYSSGEPFLFFGQSVPLEVIWTWTTKVRVHAGEGLLEMLAPLASSKLERQKAMHLFYRKQARLHLTERVEHFAQKMQLFPRQLSVRGQKTRWGSCSSRGEVSLNWKLLAAPLEVIDYVVIHELAHMRHMNHSPQFWELVACFHPEWKACRRWLKEHEFPIAVQFQNFSKSNGL